LSTPPEIAVVKNKEGVQKYFQGVKKRKNKKTLKFYTTATSEEAV
jgi:hypothetical protein